METSVGRISVARKNSGVTFGWPRCFSLGQPRFIALSPRGDTSILSLRARGFRRATERAPSDGRVSDTLNRFPCRIRMYSCGAAARNSGHGWPRKRARRPGTRSQDGDERRANLGCPKKKNGGASYCNTMTCAIFYLWRKFEENVKNQRVARFVAFLKVPPRVYGGFDGKKKPTPSRSDDLLQTASSTMPGSGSMMTVSGLSRGTINPRPGS